MAQPRNRSENELRDKLLIRRGVLQTRTDYADRWQTPTAAEPLTDYTCWYNRVNVETILSLHHSSSIAPPAFHSPLDGKMSSSFRAEASVCNSLFVNRVRPFSWQLHHVTLRYFSWSSLPSVWFSSQYFEHFCLFCAECTNTLSLTLTPAVLVEFVIASLWRRRLILHWQQTFTWIGNNYCSVF